MKQFTTICMSIGCVFLLTLQVQGGNLHGHLQQQILVSVNQQTTASIYSVVLTELQHYYDRENFNDPKRETGWYRVDNFLSWLETNASKLEEETISLGKYTLSVKQIISSDKFLKDRSLSDLLWVYLGVRYIADMYQVKADFSRLQLIMSNSSNQAIDGLGIIKISLKEQRSFIEQINLGIHEGTHILPYLMGHDKVLSELATFYSQYNYGLPVNAKQTVHTISGVRDIRQTYRNHNGLALLYEYNYFVAGLILNKHLKKKEVLQLYQNKNTFATDTENWIHVVLNLIAAENNSFLLTIPNISCTMSIPALVSYLDGTGITQTDLQKWSEQPGRRFYIGKSENLLSTISIPQDRNPKMVWTAQYSPSINSFVLQAYLPANQEQFLQGTFGKNAKYVRPLYKSIISHLPPEIIQTVKEKYPIQTPETFSGITLDAVDVRDTLLIPHQEDFMKALLLSLQELNAPISPIPQGYI